MGQVDPRTDKPLPVGTSSPGTAASPEKNPLLQAKEEAKTKASKDEKPSQLKEPETNATENKVPDVIPATAAQENVDLPPPNEEGAVGTVPVEKINPEKLKRAPPRKQNKLETSIDTAKYQADQQKIGSLEKEFEKENPDYLFPWYSVGGFDANKSSSKQMKNTRVVKSYVVENYYNDWYCNTVGVVGTCFFAWLLSYLNFSWWSLGFVFFCTASVYRSEFRRFNRNLRDDFKRVVVHETLSEKTESSLWLNSFLSKFWVIYMPMLSKQVKAAVNPQLAGAAPGYGIDALSLDEFTLGSKAPAIDAIKSYTKKGDKTVEMDWTFSFTPNDESNMTSNQVKSKINPKISLGVTVGKGIVSKTLPILVEDINVAGTARITLKFGDVFPNIKTVSVSMLEPPLIDFALKPVGGDTLGLDIMSFLPGLKTFVKSMINSNAGPMLYAPNHFDVDVEEIMAAQSNDAIGVVAVTIDSAADLKTTDFLSTSVDPYIKFEAEKGIIGNDSNIRTAIKSDNKNPRWNETKYLLVNTLDQKLTFNCFDFNDVRKDALIGSFDFDLSDLYQKPAQEHLTRDLLSKGKSRGVLNYSINWFPVIKNEDDDDVSEEKSDIDTKELDSEDDDKEKEASDSDVGIFKFTLHNVKYLNKASALTGFLSPFAELYIDGKKVKTYRTLRRINEPSWEESIEVLVPSVSKSEIALKVFDQQLTGDMLLAEYSAPMEDVISLSEQAQRYVKASPQGEIYISSSWKPVAMTGAFNVSDNIREPLGALRLHLKEAVIHESDLSGVGDIDPFVTVTSNKSMFYRTNYFSDTKTPVFNSVVYVPITSENQSITINLIDYQKMSKDRHLGSYHFSASKLIKKDPKTQRFIASFNGEEQIKCSLLNRKGRVMRSYINVGCTVVSTIPVYYPHELPEVEKLEENLKKKRDEFEAEQAELKKQMDSNPKEYEMIEVEDKFEKDMQRINRKEKMSFEELIKTNSGTCSFQIIDSSFTRPSVYLQILYDDVSYPALTSQKSKSGKIPVEFGSFFVRDLKNSIMTFRLSKKPIVKEKDDIISEQTVSTFDLLKKGLTEASTVSIKDGSKVKVRFYFNPSVSKLPPSETVTDTGILQTTFVSAENVLASDRNGKSDPMIIVKIDGGKVFQSSVVKKTLNPVWNEKAKILVPSRSRSDVLVQVYDWDRAVSNDLLGEVKWDVQDLVPNKETTLSFNLKPQGTLHVKATFVPKYIPPTVEVTEGNLAKKTVGNVANLGVGAVSGVAQVGSGVAGAGVGAVSGGLSKGGRLLKGISGTKSRSADSKDVNEDEHSVTSDVTNFGFDPSVPNTSYAPVRPQTAPTASTKEASSIQGPPGAIHKRNVSGTSNHSRATIPGSHSGKVTIVGAENLGKSVQVRVSITQGGRMKHLHRTHERKSDDKGTCHFDETVNFKATGDAVIVFGAVAHHTFSKDTELGVSQISLSDPQLHQDGQIGLRLGNGHIIFKIKYPLDGEVPPTPQIPEKYK